MNTCKELMDNFRLSFFNCFARRPVERASHQRQDEEWIAGRLKDPGTCFIPVWQTKNLVTDEKIPRAVFLKQPDAGGLIPAAESVILLGQEDGTAYFAIGLQSDAPDAMARLESHGQFKDLRAVGALLDNLEGSLLAYGRAITYWHHRHRFCGNCGSPTRSTCGGHVLLCTNLQCALEHFPRTDPAIIVTVTSGKHCLLGRQPRWREGVYSTVAGFVEPGESLESAVSREVLEETGVKVNAVHYHSSQPWPFPCSIMLGFIAEAERKNILIDSAELEDARWFSRSEIKSGIENGTLLLPGPVSIAYRLIEYWYDSDSKLHLKDIIDSR